MRAAAAALAVLALTAAVAAPAAAAAAAAGLTAAEAALYKDVLGSLRVWTKAVQTNRKMPDPPAPPPAPPVNASAAAGARPAAAAAAAAAAAPAATKATAAAAKAKAAAVAKALGTVLAAAALDAEVQGTLGAPSKFDYLDGSRRYALYRLPTSGTPRGTCILVHGCKHDPESWFYKSAACPKCTGLPEEVAHTKQCLARGYAVLALMSKDRQYKSRCFSSSTDSDHPSAKAVTEAWLRRFKLSGKPKYVFGVSAGASFALKFVRTTKLDGVVSEVNMPWANAWGAVDAKGKLKYAHPPTVFYEMQRDVTTSKQIAAALRIFKANNVPADVIKVTSDFFTRRSMYISPSQSRQLASALRKIGVIDANGWVVLDPRMNRQWTEALPRLVRWIVPRDSSSPFNLVSDESQIWQELNMAWSQHEIVADYVRPTLMWLEARGRPAGGETLASLVAKYGLEASGLSCLTEDTEGCAARRRSLRRAMLR